MWVNVGSYGNVFGLEPNYVSIILHRLIGKFAKSVNSPAAL